MPAAISPFTKSLILGAALATGLILLLCEVILQDPARGQVISWLREVLDWPLEAVKLIAILAGQQDGFQKLEAFLLGPALGASAGARLPPRGRLHNPGPRAVDR